MSTHLEHPSNTSLDPKGKKPILRFRNLYFSYRYVESIVKGRVQICISYRYIFTFLESIGKGRVQEFVYCRIGIFLLFRKSKYGDSFRLCIEVPLSRTVRPSSLTDSFSRFIKYCFRVIIFLTVVSKKSKEIV